LAENPKRLKMLFPKLDFSNSGAIPVKIFLHGEPCTVVVDDYYPFIQTDDNKLQLAFGTFNPKTKNTWPMIVEKVWAKLNYTFEDIIAGNSGEAFEFLSPAPIETYYHDVHKDTLFEEIKIADDKDYIICTDITETDTTNINYLSKMGLITNHAYTIIDVAEICDPKGNKIRLLKIRNPWGSNEWTGDWSDNSTKWTPEIKKILNYDNEDDGTFWISYEDFCKFYTTTHICMIHTDYFFVNQKFMYDKDLAFNLVKIEVNKNTKGFFVVNQKNARIYRNAKGVEGFENKYCSVITFREEDGKYTYIGANCGRQNRLYVECENITKGNYYIAVSFPVDKSRLEKENPLQKKSSIVEETFSYRVGLYSNLDKANIVDIQGEEETSIMNEFLKKVVYDLSLKNPDIYYFTEEGEKTSWRSISFEKEAGAYGYLSYNNDSDGFIYEYLSFSQLYNVNLIPIMEHGTLMSLDNMDLEDMIEDPFERNAVDHLQSNANLESDIVVAQDVKDKKDITEDNPYELIVKVGPHSKCVILIEKVEEDAGITIGSRISFSYPTHHIIKSKKFNAKKNRIKYNNKHCEIYENIIEHSSGVIFMYKNKTSDLQFSCHVVFPELENLNLSKKPEDFSKAIEENKETTEADIDVGTPDFDVKDVTREIVVTVEPGHTKFFELSSEDVFESYAYSCQMDYHINLAVSQVKQMSSSK
jgi:hypothetical protein